MPKKPSWAIHLRGRKSRAKFCKSRAGGTEKKLNLIISPTMSIHSAYPPIEVFKEIGPDSYILYLSGELDASNTLVVDEALRKALHAHKPNVVVDFEHLQYISSTGLGVFLSHYNSFTDKNISFMLVNMSPKIKSVFQLLGLEAVIPILDMPILVGRKNQNSA